MRMKRKKDIETMERLYGTMQVTDLPVHLPSFETVRAHFRVLAKEHMPASVKVVDLDYNEHGKHWYAELVFEGWTDDEPKYRVKLIKLVSPLVPCTHDIQKLMRVAEEMRQDAFAAMRAINARNNDE